MHVISGIPVGSKLRVMVGGRATHFKEIAQASTISIQASERDYPLTVSVTPNAFYTAQSGILSVGKQYSPGGPPQLATKEMRDRLRAGVSFEFNIETPDDWHFPGSDRVLPDKHGKPQWLIVKYLRENPNLAEWAIVNRPMNRVPDSPLMKLCLGHNGPSEHPEQWVQCLEQKFAGTDYCQRHAEAYGLIIPVAIEKKYKGRKPGSKNRIPGKRRPRRKHVQPAEAVTV